MWKRQAQFLYDLVDVSVTHSDLFDTIPVLAEHCMHQHIWLIVITVVVLEGSDCYNGPGKLKDAFLSGHCQAATA